MLSACSKEKEGHVTKPPTEHLYTCTSDSECRVSCESPGDCCGQGCSCTNVYVEAEYQAFHAANEARCTSEHHKNCDQYKCAMPNHKTIAKCVNGACEGTKVPITSMDEGYFRTPDSPDPLVCTKADDCIGNTLPTDDGCCNAPTTLGVYSKSYWAWINSWRAENCESVDCPTPPSPSLPPDCAFVMQCLEGQCANSCTP